MLDPFKLHFIIFAQELYHDSIDLILIFQEDKLEGVRLAIKAEGSHPHRKLRSAMEELSNGSLVGLSKERPILDHHAKAHIHEIRRISGEIHPQPYKIRCFNQNYSVWWMQERGYDPGFHRWNPLDFTGEIRQISWVKIRRISKDQLPRNGKPYVLVCSSLFQSLWLFKRQNWISRIPLYRISWPLPFKSTNSWSLAFVIYPLFFEEKLLILVCQLLLFFICRLWYIHQDGSFLDGWSWIRENEAGQTQTYQLPG